MNPKLLNNILFLLCLILIIISIIIVFKYPYLPTNINGVNTTSIIAILSTIIRIICTTLFCSFIGCYWWYLPLKKKRNIKKHLINSESISVSGVKSIFNMNIYFIIFTFITSILTFTSFFTQQIYNIQTLNFKKIQNISIPYLNFENDYLHTSSRGGDIVSYNSIIMKTGINLLEKQEPYDYSDISKYCKDNCTIPLKNFYGINITCNHLHYDKDGYIDSNTVYYGNSSISKYLTVGGIEKMDSFWRKKDTIFDGNSIDILSCEFKPATYNGNIQIYNNGTIYTSYEWVSNDVYNTTRNTNGKMYNEIDIINRYIPIMFYSDLWKGNITATDKTTSSDPRVFMYSNSFLKYIFDYVTIDNEKTELYSINNLVRTGVLHILSYGFKNGTGNILSTADINYEKIVITWNYNWFIVIIIFFLIILIGSWIFMFITIKKLGEYRDLTPKYLLYLLNDTEKSIHYNKINKSLEYISKEDENMEILELINKD